MKAVPALYPFHGKVWEIRMKERHLRQIGMDQTISPEQKRNNESMRRRQWASSSRRFIEQRKHARPTTAAEKAEARTRLYSPKKRPEARVYA